MVIFIKRPYIVICIYIKSHIGYMKAMDCLRKGDLLLDIFGGDFHVVGSVSGRQQMETLPVNINHTIYH